MFYLTGRTASRGGLRMGDLQLWPDIKSALRSLQDGNGNVSRYAGRLFKILPDGKGPTKIDVARLGYGDYYMPDKEMQRRKPVRINKAAAEETFELHERYQKHEYTPAIGPNNSLMYCKTCGAFGIKISHYSTTTVEKYVALLPQDFTSPIIFNLPDLMGLLEPDMRKALAAYLKSVGYAKLSPEKIVALDAMVEDKYAELDNEHP